MSENRRASETRRINGEEAIGNSPDEFTAQMKRDLVKWAKVVKDAKIKLD